MSAYINAVLATGEKVTILGNKISVHFLEFLSTAKNLPPGLDELATEFLELCRIIFAIEAGLSSGNVSGGPSKVPDDVVAEIDRKFRNVFRDFNSLDHVLLRLLEQERKGGKLRKGWRSIFHGPESNLDTVREALNKSREALRMSALMFQWTAGSTKLDDAVGIGYTGLAAALERLEKGRSVVGIAKVKSLSAMNVSIRDDDIMPPIPDFPKVPLMMDRRDFDLPDVPRRKSTSSRAHSDRQMPVAPSMISASSFSRAPASTRHTVLTEATTPPNRHPLSPEINEADEPIQVMRLKPEVMPRAVPSNRMRGSGASSLVMTLTSAVQAQNHPLISQLLEHGVPPDGDMDNHLLNWATRNDDFETVRQLLKYGFNPNIPSSDGITPLFVAVESQGIDAAELLLKHGADANLVAGPDLMTPLALAIMQQEVRMIELLLNYNASPTFVLPNGNTLLLSAIGKTLPKRIVDLLLAYGAEPDEKSRTGTSPLFVAIQSGRADIVQSLLDSGANPNLPGPKHLLWPCQYEPACLRILLARGADPRKAPGCMELAASLNNIESVRILLEHKVDMNARKDGVYTPLCTSIRDNRQDIFDLLLTAGADPNTMASEYPAWKCITHKRLHYLPALVKAGADLHNPKGIMEMAVAHNSMEAITMLMGYGVSPNDRNSKGATPLTTAIRENKPEIFEYLLEHGANVHVRGEDWPLCMAVKQPDLLARLLPHVKDARAYKGVMEMAVQANSLSSIKQLLAAGVSVEDRNGGVFSPLTTAIREDHKEITRFLLYEAGADPNAPGEHLPIVKAVRRHRGEDLEYLSMLIDRGADPNLIHRGWNSIMQAIEHGDPSVLKMLVDARPVDLNACDDTGRTVAELARSRGWDEGAAILFGESN